MRRVNSQCAYHWPWGGRGSQSWKLMRWPTVQRGDEENTSTHPTLARHLGEVASFVTLVTFGNRPLVVCHSPMKMTLSNQPGGSALPPPPTTIPYRTCSHPLIVNPSAPAPPLMTNSSTTVSCQKRIALSPHISSSKHLQLFVSASSSAAVEATVVVLLRPSIKGPSRRPSPPSRPHLHATFA
ncbi:uncharacterized protein EI97DRAFT_223790 [Westerdykella ornata]|uniref:Uncharacterized protein n=1 Tax=Westerdykella ornata TaxID=318751 RepID=A0A6A6JSU8_WESOR|nr:uncharacterized protein EI97DRAFT_223790 [Westerdykella ornata]KAF2278938.1 hypothetical protein EI97DRAFT_223790 [Westerdykella ornata]